jgi:hypothetical protein
MQNFIFKPKNYNTWSQSAVDKISKTIESCQNQSNLESVKNMIDNFTIIMSMSDELDLDEILQVCKQLWLSYKLKQNQLISNTI